MRRLRAVVVTMPLLLVSLLLAGCGGGGDGASTSDEPASYGSGASEPTTTAPSVAPSTTAAGTRAAATTTTAAAAAKTTPTTVGGERDLSPDPNRTIVERSGFRLHLGVGDGVRYPKDGPIALSLVVENISGEAKRYDTNDPSMFLITREGGDDVVWSEQNCRRGSTVEETYTTPAIELPPGERVGFSGRYPVSDRYDGDPTGCYLPPGRYQVWGRFPWCEPAAIENNHCRHKATWVPTLPVSIELT